MPDDGCGCPSGSVDTAGAGSSQPLDEFDLTHRAQFFWAVGAVHGMGLHEDGGAHIVPAVDVGVQFMNQVPLVGGAGRAKVPKMMMGIADRNVGF